MQNRIGSCKRKTKETDIELTINLDGQGKNQIDTGIPFFDHMLDGFARHGLFDLNVKVTGDLVVDCHHRIDTVFRINPPHKAPVSHPWEAYSFQNV